MNQFNFDLTDVEKRWFGVRVNEATLRGFVPIYFNTEARRWRDGRCQRDRDAEWLASNAGDETGSWVVGGYRGNEWAPVYVGQSVEQAVGAWVRDNYSEPSAVGNFPALSSNEVERHVELMEKWQPTSKQEQQVQADDPKKLQPKKTSVQYVPPALMEACAEALEEGRQKYGVAKWRETKTEVMTYVGGALRHIYAYVDGEDIDPDSLNGKRHLAGAVASLAILLDCIAMGTAVDNRPSRGPAHLMRPRSAK